MTAVKTLIAIGNLTMQHLGLRVEVLDSANQEVIVAGELKTVMHAQSFAVGKVPRTQLTLGIPSGGSIIHIFESQEVARVVRPQEGS